MAASEKIPVTEARRHGRHRIMLAATLHSVHGETGGVLLDVSEGGALLNASPPLPPGCKLLLERQNFEVPGTVRWVEGNRFGVQFDEPIPAELVDALVTKSAYKNAH
ncbi:PilZ domain-containing protein [Sphingomonas sp. YR710]|jgi:hypothetical protein|uniref:PilZ domain-containing protein n=1 Tax=Sphingomonas sp. YR710 TaxID=1882773 RepID=UPI000881B0A6|nr:PilZ domain-containing protein [Sphingomonas sp. YR710]SDC47316.1 PilZ domain-containing protein [Sphingomonas sp. YR710]